MKGTANRNYGIDLLRVVAMLYVVILHTLGQGKVLSNVPVNSSQYMTAWFMETWAYGAVNIFALISGYVGFCEKEKKYNYSAYLVMWLQVVLYGVSSTLIFNIFHPEIVTKNDLYQMFFPVTNGLYWYFTAYTGLFFLIPVVNAGIRNCPEADLKKLLIVIVVLFSAFDRVAKRFGLGNGYSFVWITLLYIIGAILKKCEIGKRMKIYQGWLGILLCFIVCWAWKIYGIEFQIFGLKITKDWLIDYVSPGILIASILHVIVFAKLQFSSVWKRLISFMAPGAFAVYLLNCQRYMWYYGIANRFSYLAKQNIFMLTVQVLGFSVLFVILSILIDQIRIVVFRFFRVKKVAKDMVAVIEKVLNWCIRWL